jgi:acetate kinase
MLLVLNAGSSSIKFALYELPADGMPRAAAWSGELESLQGAARLRVRPAANAAPYERSLPAGIGHTAGLAELFALLDREGIRPAAAAHRVVHGGEHYVQPRRIDAQLLAGLRALVPLAPLHQPNALAAIDALAAAHPSLPQVACFDTAFHHGLPALEAEFALPAGLRALGVRRYGFHGLSCEHVMAELGRVAGPAVARSRMVVAHLGAGASLTAIHEGRSRAVTMGFTALDGLTMARRCGAMDPGVLLYLQQQLGMGATEVAELLYQRSGLLGLSGESDDVRELLASARPEARFALEHFCYRVGRELGAMAAALGGLETLVFTGGIGEHQPAIRARIAQHAAWLGLRLDARANEGPAGDGPARLSAPDGAVAVWCIAADELGVVARHAGRLLRT